MSDRLIIVDYGCGNLNTVLRRVHSLGCDGTISDNPELVADADRLILPGVGHFGAAMERMRASGLAAALDQAVSKRKVPVLGICLGMQLMARWSEEGETEGLGWFDAEVRHFQVRDKRRFKVPHTGWNTVGWRRSSPLLEDVPDQSEFYFVHSYHWQNGSAGNVLGETEYECTFPSVVQRENMFGVQFHPEKSYDVGLQLLRNFVKL
jgi:glutamine amidotransferase